MANIKLVPSFTNEEEMKKFFTERLEIQNTFNQKVEDLKKEAKKIVEEYKEKTLYFIPMESETYVKLSVSALENFYHQINYLYSSENGILLKEIQIVHCENLSDLNLYNSFQIKFVFGQKEFNNHWSLFPFENLSFEDKKFRLVDNAMGACLDPRFLDPEKYFLVKNLLLEAQNALSKIEKENKSD